MINFHKQPIPTSMATTFLSRCLVFIVVGCLFASSVFGQQRITGLVTTTAGTPLPGATVLLLGSPTTVTTIADGSFVINADSGSTLEVSYIGYKSKRIKVGNGASLKITLSESAVNLEEVVVTGYTAQRVKEITGSVSI